MTQRRIRRYFTLSAIALMLVFACTIGYLTQAHVEACRYGYQKELSRRLLSATALLESLPTSTPFLRAVLTQLDQSSRTANFLTFSPGRISINDTTNFSFAAAQQPYSAAVYSSVYDGTFSLSESIDGGVMFSSRTVSCTVGLCMMVIFLSVYLSFAHAGNAVALRLNASLGIALVIAGTVSSIGFIVGTAVVVGNAQREVQLGERGRDMTSSVMFMNDIVRAAISVDPSAVTLPVLLGVFTSINRVSLTTVWSTTDDSLKTLPTMLDPAAAAFMTEVGDSYRVLSATNTKVLVAASSFCDALSLTIGYTFQRQSGLVASAPYVRSGITLGVVGVIVLTVALIAAMPFAALGSAPDPVVLTEPAARPLPTEEWSISTSWGVLRAFHSSLTLLVAFSACAVFVISGATIHISSMANSSEAYAVQDASSAKSLALLGALAGPVGNVTTSTDYLAALDLPSANASSLLAVLDTLRPSKNFTSPLQLLASLTVLPATVAEDVNVTSCLSTLSSTMRSKALAALYFADAAFLAAVVVQSSSAFSGQLATLVAHAGMSAPACNATIVAAAQNLALAFSRMSGKTGYLSSSREWTSARNALNSNDGLSAMQNVQLAQQIAGNAATHVSAVPPNPLLEAVKCSVCLTPVIASLVLLAVFGIVEAGSTLLVFTCNMKPAAPSWAKLQDEFYRIAIASCLLSIGGVVFVSVAYSQTVDVTNHVAAAAPAPSQDKTPPYDSLFFAIDAGLSQRSADLASSVLSAVEFKRQATAVAVAAASPSRAPNARPSGNLDAARQAVEDLVETAENFALLHVNTDGSSSDDLSLFLSTAFRPDRLNFTRLAECLSNDNQIQFGNATRSAVISALAPTVAVETIAAAVTRIIAIAGSTSCADVKSIVSNMSQIVSNSQALAILEVPQLGPTAASAVAVATSYVTEESAIVANAFPATDHPEDTSDDAVFWVPVISAWVLSPAVLVVYSSVRRAFDAVLLG